MRNITTNFCAVLCASGSISLFNSNVNLKFKSGIIGLKDNDGPTQRCFKKLMWSFQKPNNKNIDALQKKCLKKEKKITNHVISTDKNVV